jgi:hypothetical protein
MDRWLPGEKMEKDYENRAREIVERIIYVTVATVSAEGEPWNTPVYSAYDDQASFYWTSSPLARHSRNIDKNGKAFLVIYDSTAREGTGEGVYIQAIAVALADHTDIDKAKRIMAQRVGKELGSETDRLLDAGIQRIYRATPQRVWMNGFEHDENQEYLRDIRIEIPLTCLHGLHSLRGLHYL